MSDYDNTNRGAAFKPFPEQQFILQGKLNIMGDEGQVALIMAESKDGSKRIEVYQRAGVLFANKDKSDENKQPDYSGPLDGLHQDWRIAAWKEMKGDNAYMSLRVSEVQKKQEAEAESQDEPSSKQIDDDIPF